VTAPLRVEARSLRALRWRARLPRLIVLASVGLLGLAGLRTTLAPPDTPQEARVRTEAADHVVHSFAEAFVRTYLSWDSHDPARREERLATFLSRDLDADGGLSPSGSTREVTWTSVVAERRGGPRTTVVVAAEVEREPVFLAVPVQRDDRGFLSVIAYPALVGAPATSTDGAPAPELEVDDAGLRAVSERAVRNYLAGEHRNLAADLADGAVVALPGRALRVESIESITWAVPGRRVAVQLRAEEPGGSTWTLRYELGVVRRERWYVRQLHVDPRSKGATS
jgi:hypothetical protein